MRFIRPYGRHKTGTKTHIHTKLHQFMTSISSVYVWREKQKYTTQNNTGFTKHAGMDVIIVTLTQIPSEAIQTIKLSHKMLCCSVCKWLVYYISKFCWIVAVITEFQITLADLMKCSVTSTWLHHVDNYDTSIHVTKKME